MQNIWVISGGRAGRGATFEYYASEEAATARAHALEALARQSFEKLDRRVDLDVVWERYCEIQDLRPYEVQLVPDVASLNSDNDDIAPSGEAPSDRLWVVLEDGRPEVERGFVQTEEDAADAVWDRNWARWEGSLSSVLSLTDFRAQFNDAQYDYAPADPGPQQA